MLTTPKDFPTAPMIEGKTPARTIELWAKSGVDPAIKHICDNAASQPLVIRDVVATNATQEFSHPFGNEPSEVLFLLTRPPIVRKVGGPMGPDLAAPFLFEHGNHDKAKIRVKVTFSAGAEAPMFDLVVFR